MRRYKPTTGSASRSVAGLRSGRAKDRAAARAELGAPCRRSSPAERLTSPSARPGEGTSGYGQSAITLGPVLRSQIARLGILVRTRRQRAIGSVRMDLLDKPSGCSSYRTMRRPWRFPALEQFGTFAEARHPAQARALYGHRIVLDFGVHRDITIAPGQEMQTISGKLLRSDLRANDLPR